MPHPNRINPATGKRYGWTPPEKRSAEAQQAEKAKQTDQQLLLLKRQRAALLARTSLLAYTRYTMPDPEAPADPDRSTYDAQRFHQLIATELDKFLREEMLLDDGSVCRGLIFCMPPRHGKTELATKRLVAQASGAHPKWDIAVASYSDKMAEDFGADTRAILTSPAHKQVFPSHKLRRGGTAKDNIQTADGGRLVFVGRGGALTGRGADLAVGDDLFKDHEEARSQAIRDQAWNWFTKVLMTRRMGPKLVLLTMTRWNSDDIIGRITDKDNPHYNENQAKRWKIIRLPAIAEDDDPLGREKGEPLWPVGVNGEAKYDLEFLDGQRELDALGFEALYQQNPTVADGTVFLRENIRYYKSSELPDELRVYCASDHAVSTKQRRDPSCFLKVGVDRQDNIYLLECWWKRARTDEAVEAMLTMGATGNMQPLIWWAERGQITGSIGPFLRKRMQETRQYINIVEVTPKADKEQRAQSAAARVGMGKILWPVGAWWTEKSISELMAFPNGVHDDFVDALAYIGLGLPRQVRASAPPKKQEVPKFGTFAWVKYTAKWDEEEAKRKAMGGF
jgi:predicted phage terminase large subunit-like protein